MQLLKPVRHRETMSRDPSMLPILNRHVNFLLEQLFAKLLCDIQEDIKENFIIITNEINVHQVSKKRFLFFSNRSSDSSNQVP
jgi:hypothetical protein